MNRKMDTLSNINIDNERGRLIHSSIEVRKIDTYLLHSLIERRKIDT